MPAPLEDFLRAYTSGANVFTPEMLDHFGGEQNLLAALRSFDPDAKASITELGGGEGGSQGQGIRFDFDVSKAPKSKGGTLGLDLRNSNFGKLKDPNAVYDDSNYGKVTNSANVVKPTDPLWVKLAPIAVSMLGPMAGAALAGAGIGGAAGLTAGVTGSGLGGASSLPSWLTGQMGKLPSYARSLANGGDWRSLVANAALGQGANAAGSALNIDPNVVKTALTLGQLARKR